VHLGSNSAFTSNSSLFNYLTFLAECTVTASECARPKAIDENDVLVKTFELFAFDD